MSLRTVAAACAASIFASAASAGFIAFEATGVDAAAISPTVDAFRTAVGGGSVAGPNGSFGGVRREINWDGVPDALADPNLLPADIFNVNSPRGVLFSTPGTGFLVSADAGDPTPTLFGFPNDLQAFSAQRLFAAVNSNVVDVLFFMPGTNHAATTSAFGLIFVDVEVANATRLDFFDATNTLLFSRSALVAGNQGFSFLGALADAGEEISRVRITSGTNTIVSNGVMGNPFDDLVVMDDFIYAQPSVATVPEPATLALLGLGLAGLCFSRRPRDHSGSESVRITGRRRVAGPRGAARGSSGKDGPLIPHRPSPQSRTFTSSSEAALKMQTHACARASGGSGIPCAYAPAGLDSRGYRLKSRMLSDRARSAFTWSQLRS